MSPQVSPGVPGSEDVTGKTLPPVPIILLLLTQDISGGSLDHSGGGGEVCCYGELHSSTAPECLLGPDHPPEVTPAAVGTRWRNSNSPV